MCVCVGGGGGGGVGGTDTESHDKLHTDYNAINSLK